jgi:hypothetical protein
MCGYTVLKAHLVSIVYCLSSSSLHGAGRIVEENRVSSSALEPRRGCAKCSVHTWAATCTPRLALDHVMVRQGHAIPDTDAQSRARTTSGPGPRVHGSTPPVPDFLTPFTFHRHDAAAWDGPTRRLPYCTYFCCNPSVAGQQWQCPHPTDQITEASTGLIGRQLATLVYQADGGGPYPGTYLATLLGWREARMVWMTGICEIHIDCCLGVPCMRIR